MPLHDATRRRVCLAAWLLAGLLPALGIGGWCLGRHLPGRARSEAETLGRRLGLNVKLDGVKYLRPGAMLYEGFRAFDPETDRPVFRCRLLEIACRQGDAKSRPTVAVVASQPEVSAAELPSLWRRLRRAMEKHPGGPDADVRFSAAELTLVDAVGSQTFANVQGRIETLPGGTHAQARFHLVGAEPSDPACIRLVRNRQVSPPADGFELDTGGGALPCNVLALGLPELRPLGPRCSFSGSIRANESPDGWEGEVVGHFADVDLSTLMTDYFPHHLSGRCDVTVERARFRRGRLVEGSATLVAGPGTVGRSLMSAAVERLGLVPAEKALAADSSPLRPKVDEKNEDADDRIPYQRLAFSAMLDADGLRIRGRCATDEPGTVLRDADGRLLGEPKSPCPVVALVQMLASPSLVQVPAGRQTDWLLRHLPIPAITTPPGDKPPTARLRLPDTWRR